MTVHIGSKIRELRKKKGITQEALAGALLVSPQAVSKWESGYSYPDMEMIPVIAGYFEVSMDILFDYDIREMKTKIQKIIKDAHAYFFDDTEKYAETIDPNCENFQKITALPADGTPAKMYIDYIRLYQKGDKGEKLLINNK